MRKSLIGTSALLGLGLVLSPVAANAATPAPAPVASQSAATLDSPTDLTSYAQQLAAYNGALTQTITVQGLPGATINYSVNGIVQTKQANAKGIAKFTIQFVQGKNDITVSQIKGGEFSAAESYQYDLTRF